MLHFTVISSKKNDETLIETKQHFLAFESESNKEKLHVIGFVVENEKRQFVTTVSLTVVFIHRYRYNQVVDFCYK